VWRITRDARQSIKILVVPYGPLRENVHDGYTAGDGIRSIRSQARRRLLSYDSNGTQKYSRLYTFVVRILNAFSGARSFAGVRFARRVRTRVQIVATRSYATKKRFTFRIIEPRAPLYMSVKDREIHTRR